MLKPLFVIEWSGNKGNSGGSGAGGGGGGIWSNAMAASRAAGGKAVRL